MARNLIVENLVAQLISLLNDNSLFRDKKSQNILDQIKSFFSSEHTKPELDFVLSVLFKPDDGLLHFIKEGCCEKTLKPGIKESLLLIIDLFKKYTQDLGLVKYFVQTKDTCYYVVLRYNICGADVLKCAFEVIKEIITSKEALKVKEDLKIPELIGFLYCRCLTDKSIKATALQEVYELFGAIASTFPECFGDSQIKSFVRKVLDELKLQLKQTNNVKPCIIEGCMNALKGVFSNFPRAYDDPDKELAEQSKTIYLYIKDAFQGDSTRKAYQRATLDLFATHIELLWGWVVEFKDVNYWLPLLSLWAGKISAEDKQIGVKAVRALHEKAMNHITSHPDDAMKHDFLSYYKRVLECHRAASYNMDLAIEGISTLAGISSNEINQTDVTNIFRLILQRAQTDFPLQDSTTAERSDSDERLAKYLESLSNVCSKLSSVTNDQLSGMTRLWRLLVERYPHHYARTQIIMVDSLSVTMLRMGMCDPSVFARFLYPVVYQSILVTCCHTLVEEAELQEELTQREVITYKNYKKLWEGLFRVGYETKNKRKVQGVTPQLRRMVLESLYDCFVKSLVAIIGKLNVKLCDKDETNEEVKTDPESNLKSENPQDHNVLCNLANLYKDLLVVLDSERLSKWLSELLSTVINQSVQSPLVSAFYKLLAALLSVAQRTNYFLDESEEVQSLGQYIVRYLEDVMLQCQQYKNDLQASCLLALVSVPVPLIKPLLAGIAPVMQMIFRLGQSLLSLAVQGMNALELWQRSLPPDELKPILHHVLPWFDPYLRSRGITTELPEDENLQMSKRQQKRERRIKEATRLAELQKRMLRLLGQLDSATCLTLLSHPTDITTWSDEPMVNFKMPFPDQRFSVPMDSLLPRVVELAMTSSDRQTKAAACEVLHAFVLLFIGNGTTVIETKQPELESILSRLMPSLLRLSCGSDLVAMQLFRPLTLQLMRWFCFPKMLHCKKPVQTQAVLQAVWDGITDEEDVALQDFSALCLKEFVHWSIKQSPDQLLVDRPLGPKAITRIINSYCLHPSLTKRRGAALAFSHIAGELRKPPLLDMFWLELMYHLVLNLELGGASHNHPATAALTVVGKVMKKKADLFNEKSDARRVPDALGSGTLLDVVKFLAQKCGSQTVICATKCRELILELMPLVPDIPPLDQLVDIVSVCEGAGSGLMLPIQPGVSDADHLRASIDCYAWCIKKSFIPPFVAIQSPSRLVPCVEYFVNMLDLTVVPTLLCSRQETVLMKAKCGVVVALFDLLALLYSQIKKLPYTFFQRNFWKLLAMCIFASQNVGLDWRNKELAEHLSDKIRLLLCTLRDQMKPADLDNMYEALSSQVLYDCTTCVERLSLMCQGLQPLELKDKQYVDGLITLYKTDLLQHLKFGRTWFGNTLLRGVFNSLFDSDELPLHPESSVKGFQQKLLHLAFLLGAEVNSSLAWVMDKRPVNDRHVSLTTTVTKGQHFLKLFEDQLISHLLQEPASVVSRLLDQPTELNIQIILLMVSACKYSKVKFNRSAEALLSSLTKAWSSLEAWAGADQTQLVSLVQGLVQCLPPAQLVGGLSTTPVCNWLYSQIKNSSLQLQSKAEMLELLPSVVSRATDTQLEEVLNSLEKQFPVCTGELRSGSFERTTYVSVYTALLHTLVAAGSIPVLRVVCASAADKDHYCADAVQTALIDFVTKHKNDVQMEALKTVYNKFMDETKDVEYRLGLMSRILITLLCHASKTVVTQFYADTITNIMDIANEKLRTQSDNTWKTKQQLASKIGGCQLLEPLFNRITKIELEDENHPVTKAAKEKLSKFTGRLCFVRRSRLCNEELQDLFRRYQCAAYNALALFVSNTNLEMKHFNVFLFKEETGAAIWRNIIPVKPKYCFPIAFNDYPKIKKQLVQMRSLASIGEEGSDQHHVVYLPSQSLFSSSLQEDITCFDFSMYSVRNEDRMKEVMNKEDGGPSTVRLELEEDSLNNHESMSVLISVIKHLCKTFPSNTAKEQRPKPPQWMEHLRASLTAPDQPDNCRAFIVKLILNCQSHFKEYAYFWISPIIQCVIDNCFGVEMNYLVHDIVRMFYNWRDVAVPDSRIEDELKASEFLRILVMRSDNEQGIIARYNVEVVRIVVTMWKRIVQVPYQELLDLLRPSASEEDTTTGRAVVDVGISLADVFIVNNILPFNQTGKTTYYEYLLAHLQRADKKVYEPCATVIGRILSVVSKDGELQGEDLDFFHKVVECINPGKGMENDKFITCLHKIQAWYPEIVKGFEAQCISLMNLPSIFSVKTLEILTTALKFDFRHEAFSMITGLPRMVLDESNPDRQVAALELIKELQPHLTPSQMKQLFPAVVSVRNHKRVETRNVVYEIVSWIYDNYRHMADEDAVAQVKEAKLVLISGMVDPDQKLQKKYHIFWNSNDRLSSRGWGRLVDILRLLYSPSCEAAFLTISTTLLLDLCGQTDEYNRTIFDQPLSACKFEKYNVSGSFRTQHATFVPMFANTLASQINSLSLGSYDLDFQIRATQEPSPSYSSTLQPSLPISSVQDQSLYSFAGPSTSKAQFGNIHNPGSSFGSDHLVTADNTDGEPNTLRLPTRLLLNKDKLRYKYAERNRQQSAQVQRHKAERQRRSENDVTLMRDYRRGDLPDIQIPCSDVVIALRSLAKRDQLIARQLLVAIYKALVDTNVNTDLSGVSSAVDDILQTSTSHEPSLIATMLEMGLVRPSECRSPASIIAEVSKNSHQMSVGALLVEAKLMSEETLPPPHKRVRVNHDINYNDWMYLAEIYHSLEEKDVVQGLFEDKIAEACSRDVREALQAEDQQRWKKAQKKYTECLQSNSGTAAENFLYEASFKCCAHLSEWKELNKSLKETQLHNNLEQVWDDNWKQDHLLPWLFLSEIHYTQTTNVLSVTKDFNSALKCWLEDPTKKAHVESKLADMLSLLLVVNGDVPRAKLVSDASVMQFLAVWQQLDCLNNNLRGSHLLNVHRLMDTDRFLELASDVDRSKKVFRLVDQWKKSSPSKTDNLVSWETQSVYRNIYAKKIEDDLKREGNPTTSIHQLRTHNYLKTLDCALKQKNFYVARRYLDKCKYEMKGSLDNRLLLCNSKVKLLRAELERNELDHFSTDEKKNEIFNSQVEHIIKAWDPLDKLREQDASGLLDHPLNIELHFHTAEVYQTLLAVAQQRPSGLDNLDPSTVEKLRLEPGDGSVEARLKRKVVDCLGQAVAAAEKRPPSECDVLADAYLKLTVFCHEIDDAQYRDKLIQSLLRSMKYGSKEARILFPCLLDTSLADHRDLFLSEYKQVPEWMFLSWVAQLLAHLDTEVGHVVAPLLVDLAKTYPAALQFPFHLSKEMYQYKHPATRDTVNQLSDLLKMDQTTSDLLSGLSCVCQPHGCLMYHIEMLRTVLTQNLGSDAFNEAYELMKKEAFPPKQDDKIKGIAFNSVQKLTDELESLYSQYMNKTTSTDEFSKQLGTLYMKARNDKKKFKGIEMAAYSPWLMNGYKGNVEIPGQYTGQSRPLPNHHVTISSFNRFVKSQDSLRSPIKITILGNDAKEHPFLVKFGEDLRQDQRIQQLFGLMNQLLSADVTASKRQLSVHTYGVVPLNNRFGIIQWVEKTTTLKDFMTSAVPIENIDAAQHIYHRQHFGRFENDSVKFYKRVEREDSIKMYNLAVNKLPTFMLRDAVLRLSISPEAFMHLRSTMLTDHSCLSVCQWLLGIGDRHLSNTLVCKDTGRLLGIDFGHAFGTATQLLSVPELMPFRLTPQILNLAAPFQTTGLIKESMVHTLRVLRENRRLLLATMTVFILEPSVDWMKAARKHVAYMADETSETGDWFPQLKISLARRKLEGANPRRMVEEDLRLGHQTKPHYDNLLRLLYDGTDDGELRDELSPRHQVECLIDHATNKHILSKTWSGWGSWM